MDKEYIEREAALKCLREVYDGFSAMTPTYYNGYMNAVYHVKNTVPTADVVEVVHGRWIKLDAHKGMEQFKCSVCRSECYVPTCMGEPMYAFCPNCGNPMDGGAENE